MGDAPSRAGDAVLNVPGVFAPQPLYCGDDSVLYRARRDPGGTRVVVKFARARGPREERDEIELWRMHSSNRGVHSLLQHGTAGDGRPYAVMEDCPDGDYRRILAEQGPVAVAEGVAVGTAVADALAAVHARGLLHHAVAPENILRARFGPALIDFGSALPRDHPFPPAHHRDGAVEHVPPEQLAGALPGPASDVYRLASTVWTLLAGHPPFADGAGEAAEEAQRGAPAASYRVRVLGSAPPRVPREDVPERIQDVLRRALAADPAERVGDAAAFASLLRGEDAADPAEAPPPLPTTRRPGPRPDHRPPPGTAPAALSPGRRRLQQTAAAAGTGVRDTGVPEPPAHRDTAVHQEPAGAESVPPNTPERGTGPGADTLPPPSGPDTGPWAPPPPQHHSGPPLHATEAPIGEHKHEGPPAGTRAPNAPADQAHPGAAHADQALPDPARGSPEHPAVPVPGTAENPVDEHGPKKTPEAGTGAPPTRLADHADPGAAHRAPPSLRLTPDLPPGSAESPSGKHENTGPPGADTLSPPSGPWAPPHPEHRSNPPLHATETPVEGHGHEGPPAAGSGAPGTHADQAPPDFAHGSPEHPANPLLATDDPSSEHRRERPPGTGLPFPEPLPPPVPAAEVAAPPALLPDERSAGPGPGPARSAAADAPARDASGAEDSRRHAGSAAGADGHSLPEPSGAADDAAVTGLDAVPEPPYALDPGVAPATRGAVPPPYAFDGGTAAAPGGTPGGGVPPWQHPPIGPPQLPPTGGPPLDALLPPVSGNRKRRRAGRVALYALAASALLAVVAGAAWLASPLLSSAPASSGHPPAAAEASPEPSAPPAGGGPLAADDAEAADAAEDAAQDASDGTEPSGDATGPADIAPTSVEIRDGTISVALSWADSTGGAATHHVVGGPVGAGEDSGMASVPAGETSVEITGLNPDVEYCFRVVAVQSIDLAAASKEVCTDRGSQE
ncbi:hypothetical protein GCM10023224_25960 [Streptomonospora halophila]|uniref:Serine/threonine protein kinase n=1 Tax=Streptomonospora halophila TaxID=427369 RepID=A0ABP9GGP4_9ACTN